MDYPPHNAVTNANRSARSLCNHFSLLAAIDNDDSLTMHGTGKGKDLNPEDKRNCQDVIVNSL
jgi:hypothetical protein